MSLILKFCIQTSSPDTLFPLVYAMPLVFKLPPKILLGYLKKKSKTPPSGPCAIFYLPLLFESLSVGICERSPIRDL